MARTFKSKEEERLYNCWRIMRQNCNSPKAKDYKTYGGRGITLCEEWMVFDNFCKWALENGYELGKVLQRKDRNGNFCPENCYFVDKAEVNTGIRSNSFIVEYNGKTYTNESFAREVGMNPHLTLKYLKAGKKPEEIVAERDPDWDKYICHGHSNNSAYRTEDSMPNSPHNALFRVKRYTMNGVSAPMETLIEMFGEDESFLSNASAELLRNQNFIEKALTFNPKAYFGLPESMQMDKRWAELVISKDYRLLNCLPESLQSDYWILYSAMKQNPDVAQFLSPEIRQNPDVQANIADIRIRLGYYWKEVYAAWKKYDTTGTLSDPNIADIKIDFHHSHKYTIFCYDWLRAGYFDEPVISEPYSFDLINHANKGVVRTAEFLAAAKDDEKRAAIWIVATIHELLDEDEDTDLSTHAYQLFEDIARTASSFAEKGWHNKTIRMIPDIYITQEQLDNVKEGDIEEAIRLIQMNTAEVKRNYQIYRYSEDKVVDEDSQGWICTDPDCMQYGKKLSDMSWQYIECREYPNDRFIVCGTCIDLLDYGTEKVNDYVSGYYESLAALVAADSSANESLQIAAECVFEQLPLDQMDFCISRASFEEAESYIKKYIAERA